MRLSPPPLDPITLIQRYNLFILFLFIHITCFSIRLLTINLLRHIESFKSVDCLLQWLSALHVCSMGAAAGVRSGQTPLDYRVERGRWWEHCHVTKSDAHFAATF